jgi:hypothetical protein
MKRFHICVLLLGAAIASGCARTQAKTTPDNPPLDMPAPPERDIESNEEDRPLPLELPAEPARSTIPPRVTPQTRTEPPRSDPKPETPPAAETPRPAPGEEPSRAPSNLQTIPVAEEAGLEKSIRAAMSRAQRDLNRVDYRSLNQEVRDQYEVAKSLIRQADDAIRVKNLTFAKTVADKAAVLAAQLAGRR